jgi:hypothetical protein
MTVKGLNPFNYSDIAKVVREVLEKWNLGNYVK